MNKVDSRYYEVAAPGSISERLAIIARDIIYDDFMRLCSPISSDKILDVGVSGVVCDAANVIERRYTHRERITAVGIGRGDEFIASFPQVKYQQIAVNEALPFVDRSFDVVTSNAVLEHVGSIENQRFFISELMRVGGRVFITVPNRFFPVEHHTAIPFLHWFDATFTAVCQLSGKEKWSRPENLILMSRQRLKDVCPAGGVVKIGATGIRLGPFSSNLYLFAHGPVSEPL